MSREVGHDRESLMSVCTLPADARVADFLIGFAEKRRRDLNIPDVKELSAFVQRCLAPTPLLQ